MDRKPFKFKAKGADAAWNYVTGQLFMRRNAEVERVEAAVRAAPVPMPEDIVNALAQLNPNDLYDVLRAHPGHKLWELNKSYQLSYEIFERAVADLLRAIDSFGVASRDSGLLDRKAREERREFESAIQKELFAAANAAHSLVDHSTRKLQREANVSDYEKQLAACFGKDGVHETVMGLRNILHHFHVLRPTWQWTKSFKDGTTTFSFNLETESLLQVAKERKGELGAGNFGKIEKFLSKAGEKIDLRQLFVDYLSRAADFHSWFAGALNAHAFENLRDLERCVKENKKNAQRIWWGAMLGNWLLNWKEPPNPYDHLPLYLTSEQLQEVYKLPMGSIEQVDKVIEFVDEDRACSDHIRKQAYELFRRALP